MDWDDKVKNRDSAWLSEEPLPSWADEAKLDEQIESCLAEVDRYAALRRLVRQWFRDGLDEGEVLGVFTRFRQQLRDKGRETEEDDVDTIVDCLIGWCAPYAVLRRENAAGQDRQR